MANHISRGEPIFIPFKDGKTVSDSQNKARMYKTKRAFEKSFPKLDVAIEKVELVEYAEVRHGRWEHVKRHMWHKDKDGNIDEWAMEHEFHNGPICEVCGRSTCVHCTPNWEDEECDIGYFICGVCKRETRTPTHYCPDCGTKLDAEE